MLLVKRAFIATFSEKHDSFGTFIQLIFQLNNICIL